MISAYHPFYITDDKEGGYQYKTTSQRRKTKVFSGIENNRLSGATPTGIGRLCEWREDPQQPADSFSSFGAYQVITEGYTPARTLFINGLKSRVLKLPFFSLK